MKLNKLNTAEMKKRKEKKKRKKAEFLAKGEAIMATF